MDGEVALANEVAAVFNLINGVGPAQVHGFLFGLGKLRPGNRTGSATLTKVLSSLENSHPAVSIPFPYRSAR